MKQLQAGRLYNSDSNTTVKVVSCLIDQIKRNELDQLPWTKYPYFPAVEFAIAYNPGAVFLKFYVTEKSIRAVNSRPNSEVWEDSCVEFFINFGEDEEYYNFEFNCIGTAKVGHGNSKHGRRSLPESLLQQIKYQSVIDNQPDNEIRWELTLIIPKELFCFNEIATLQGQSCRANFYKCGDQLPTPHFITWSGIQSEEPDFHLPEFFGALHFV